MFADYVLPQETIALWLENLDCRSGRSMFTMRRAQLLCASNLTVLLRSNLLVRELRRASSLRSVLDSD